MITLTSEEKTAFNHIRKRRSRTGDRIRKINQFETELKHRLKRVLFRRIIDELTSPFVADRYCSLRKIAELENTTEHELAREVFNSASSRTKLKLYPLLKQFIGRKY